MPNNQEKNNILGCLSGIKFLENFNIDLKLPNFNFTFPSLSFNKDLLSFLLDILKLLVGLRAFLDIFINFFVVKLNDLERKIKIALTKCLLGLGYCKVDFIVPNYLITDGINLDVSQVDFFCFFNINPTSDLGKLMYEIKDDLNKRLYDALQDPGQQKNWKDIIFITYNENIESPLDASNYPNDLIQDTNNSLNTINIKINPSYANGEMSIFIEDFINSFRLFTVETTFLRITDELWGTVSRNQNASKFCIDEKNKLNHFTDKILESDDDIIIDNSFFDFEDQDISRIQARTESQYLGFNPELAECCPSAAQITPAQFKGVYNVLTSDSENVPLKERVEGAVDIVTNFANRNVSEENKDGSTVSIIIAYIKTFVKVIFSSIFSPKVMILFGLLEFLNNGKVRYNSLNEFFKINKKILINLLKKTILNYILVFLSLYISGILTKLKEKELNNRIKEQANNYLRQINSLVELVKNKFSGGVI